MEMAFEQHGLDNTVENTLSAIIINKQGLIVSEEMDKRMWTGMYVIDVKEIIWWK